MKNLFLRAKHGSHWGGGIAFIPLNSSRFSRTSSPFSLLPSQALFTPCQHYHDYASATDCNGPSCFPADVASALCTLGIQDSSCANSETVKKKYKQLVAKFHPDVPGGSDAKMKSVNTAYDVIRKYEEQHGGTLKPSTRAHGHDSRMQADGFSEAEANAFREHVRRHASFHVRHDDEDAFETFHDFVFGGGLKQNFHTVEFKQRTARRKKPTVYDEYKYFTSFEDNDAEERFFDGSEDYMMNEFADCAEPPRRHNQRRHEKHATHTGRNDDAKRSSQKPHAHRKTFYDEFQNDSSYQQQEPYFDADEMFYSPNRFYGTQQRGPNRSGQHKHRRDGQNPRSERSVGDEDRRHKGRNQHRRRSSYNIDDSPIDFM